MSFCVDFATVFQQILFSRKFIAFLSLHFKNLLLQNRNYSFYRLIAYWFRSF